MAFSVPDLAYPFDALEPHIDARTMEIHHDKHHAAYVTNLNAAIEGTEWANQSIETVLTSLDSIPEDKRAAVRNNGGGHANHTLFWEIMPTGIQRVFAPDNPALDIDGADDARVDVDVAVIDTGIQLDHPDLNVVGGTNCVTFFATCGSGWSDGNGHGTHVAGTIGALDNGVGVVGIAPGARLWSVRVLGNNGTGTTSQIVAGIDWVTGHARDR